MRIGLIPEGLRERALFESRRFPQPVFDVMGTMLLSRAVMAGARFGVFDRLAGGPKTAPELAAEAGCDAHGMTLLVDALVACCYLQPAGDRYRNSRLGDWLVSRRPQTLANFVLFNYDQWEWIGHLEEFIQSGRARSIHEQLQGLEWRTYLLGLEDLARLSASALASKLKLGPAARRLLDVGGGHGYYSVALCQRYPALRATVIDLEPAAEVGRERVAQAGLSGRIEFRPGNLKDTPFGDNHDVALVLNLLHHLDEPTCRATLRRLHAALAPAGKLVVWETFRAARSERQRDQLGSLMALFFGVTSGRETYEFEQVAEWVRAAGFTRLRREKLRTAPFAGLLLAVK